MKSLAPVVSVVFACAALTAAVPGAAPAAPAAPAGKPAPAATAPAPAVAAAATSAPAAAAQPAADAYDRFKSLVGDWIDVDGTFGMQGQVAASYRVTGAGTTVVETLMPGTPHEMMTMYSRDGGDLVLTHYCAGGNQPHMRAKHLDGATIRFAFDGGTNLDPAKDSHMHSAWYEFVSADEIRGEWQGWDAGKPSEHSVRFHLKRKTA